MTTAPTTIPIIPRYTHEHAPPGYWTRAGLWLYHGQVSPMYADFMYGAHYQHRGTRRIIVDGYVYTSRRAAPPTAAELAARVNRVMCDSMASLVSMSRSACTSPLSRT